MKRDKLEDKKNLMSYAFWSSINWLAIGAHFHSFEVVGHENLPDYGSFFLVSNHVARWDGLVVYNTIGRPTNFMVSPNELLGFQGKVLRSMGSFPADPRLDLQTFVDEQIRKGEGFVIFPEGDIYRDGTTHQFKTGTARLALNAAKNGHNAPLIPAAIHYSEDGKKARMIIGEHVDMSPYAKTFDEQPFEAIKTLTTRLHREVCHLKFALGAMGDTEKLFISSPWQLT